MKILCIIGALLFTVGLMMAEGPDPAGQVIVNERNEQGWHRLLTKNIPLSGEWVEHTMTFTPSNTGKVQFLLMGNNGLCWYDNVIVDGCEMVNGDFEVFDNNGRATGWSFNSVTVNKNSAEAQQGEAFVKVGGKKYAEQWLTVEAGKVVTVKLYAKKGNPLESVDDTKKTTQAPDLRDAAECTARDGLPNFLEKCEKGGNVTIAYFGGSITEQAGWRVQSLAYLQKQYPQAKLSGINAAIGGTGSMLGVFRVDHDVLAYQPDLVFVEFAVNDAGGNKDNITKSMEGIVRKIWKQYPNCDICFVYTLTDQLLPDWRDHKFPPAVKVMEQVAAHYGIPSISLGMEVADLEKAGKLQMKSPGAAVTQVSGKELDQNAPLRIMSDGKIPFSADGVHPYNDTGHRLYTAAVIRALPSLKNNEKIGPHVLPKALNAGNLENTVMLPIDQAAMTGPWKKLNDSDLKGNVGQNLADRVASLWQAEPGAELSFRFRGSRAMIYDIKGPGCGKLEVTLDGKTSTVIRMDGYCTFYRLATFDLAIDTDPDKIHEIKIKVLDDNIDKENILFERNRQDFKNNPAKYAADNWYVGAIFLVGKLVK